MNLHPCPPPATYVRPSQLQNLKGSQQAAAICFRMGTEGIEFLLVRTGSGRWTFPKGAVESGLTLAQSAALEAFEEAGVHGRIEEAPFGRYRYRKRGAKRGARRELSVHAHLCQVRRLSRPKELHRKPTWFSVAKAKRRLQQDRAPDCAAELTRVLDLAVLRIRTLATGTLRDSLRSARLQSPVRSQLAPPIKSIALPSGTD